MSHPAHPAKTRSPRTGFSATLRALLPVQGTGARRHPKAVAAALFAATALLAGLLTASPALALPVHTLATSFGGPGSADGQLSLAGITEGSPEKGTASLYTNGSGLAVNDTTHDVYVADTGNHRVVEFSASGTFIRAFGADVGGAGVDVCTSGCVAGTSGSSPGAFQAPTYVAVDNSGGVSEGDVYVGDSGDSRISKFDETGHLIASWGNHGIAFNGLAGITVDSAGALYAYDNTLILFKFAADGTISEQVPLEHESYTHPGGLGVDSAGDFYVPTAASSLNKYDSTGKLLVAGISRGPSSGLAVDSSTDDLYNNTRHGIVHLSSSGLALERPFGAADLSEGSGLAVDSADHTVYAADAATDKVIAFDQVIVPDATTGDFSELTDTTVKLAGTINPDQTAASYQFEYGPDTSYGQLEPASPATVGNDNASHEESAELTGLQPSTTYHYRIDAINSNGTNPGEDASFHTHGPPNVDEVSVSGISGVGATIHGTLNPSGFATTYRVEYGPTESYGSETAPIELAAADEAEAISVALAGLSPETTYHFRLVAENSQGDTNGVDHEFETGPPLELGSQSASSITGVCATLNAQVNPEGTDTSLHFEYGPTNGYGSTTASVDAGAANAIEDPPGIEVCGLSPLTTYHYRAIAENPVGARQGNDATFETEPPVQVAQESVAHTTAHCATLQAQVNPFGASGTTVHFAYGTSAAYGSESASTTVAAAAKPVQAGVEVCGLTPLTEYHFRAFAANAGGGGEGEDASFITYPEPGIATTSCPNQALRTGLSAPLPDCRAYEMLTPPQNDDAEVFAPYANNSNIVGEGALGYQSHLAFQVAADGEAVAYPGEGTVGGTGAKAGAGGLGGEYLSSRGAGGWSQANIQPDGNLDDSYQAFSADLSVGVLGADSSATYAPLGAGAPAGFATLYTRALPAGPYAPLTTTTPPNRGAAQFGSYGIENEYTNRSAPELTFAGASAGFDQLLFEANDALTPAAEANPPGETENDLYDSAAGRLSLVNVLPDGAVAPGASFGAPNVEKEPNFDHVISADGSRVFWTDEANGSLYLRRNPTQPQSPLDGESCEVPADACTVLIATNARYWTATPDGSQVFFTRSGHLYDDHISAEEVTDLSGAAEAQSLIGVSADGSYVYFLARKVLAANHNSEGVGATAGAENIYLRKGEEPIRFIATLSAHDESDAVYHYYKSESFGDTQPALGHRTAELTPDGHSLLFVSNDQTGPGFRVEAPPVGGNGPVSLQEAYVYEAEADALHCVSCDPSGAAPQPNGQAEREGLAAILPPSHQDTYQPRWISANGARVFFDSAQPLVPADTDGIQDAYEWERDGAGACTEAAGCIYLLSNGAGESGSSLIGASASGDDVFFTARAQLTPEDGNEDFNVFDARVDGGFPPPPPPCEGESCSKRQAAPPSYSTPGSATFHGPSEGAAHPEKPKAACKVGFLKSHGRCVKRHHKQSHKRGGGK